MGRAAPTQGPGFKPRQGPAGRDQDSSNYYSEKGESVISFS